VSCFRGVQCHLRPFSHSACCAKKAALYLAIKGTRWVSNVRQDTEIRYQRGKILELRYSTSVPLALNKLICSSWSSCLYAWEMHVSPVLVVVAVENADAASMTWVVVAGGWGAFWNTQEFMYYSGAIIENWYWWLFAPDLGDSRLPDGMAVYNRCVCSPYLRD